MTYDGDPMADIRAMMRQMRDEPRLTEYHVDPIILSPRNLRERRAVHGDMCSSWLIPGTVEQVAMLCDC